MSLSQVFPKVGRPMLLSMKILEGGRVYSQYCLHKYQVCAKPRENVMQYIQYKHIKMQGLFLFSGTFKEIDGIKY